MKLSKGIWAIILIGFILLMDQTIKFWIKTHLFLYEDRRITDWFHIRFVENNGMAMGIRIIDKLVLSIIRILTSCGIAYYLYQLIKRNASLGYILCIAMVFAGSIGNIIDNIFYGVIFSESQPNSIAIFFPSEQSGAWLYGKVVDMFYFPLFEWTWPEKIPFIGGHQFSFFRYIFNLADASISIGIIVLLLFYRNAFSKSVEKSLRYHQ